MIAECVEAILPMLNEHYGKSLTIDDIVHYDLAEVLEIAREEMDQFFDRVGEEGVYRELMVIEGAKDALTELARRHHHIKLITFRSVKLRDDTEHWLRENAIPFDDVLYVGKSEKADHITGCDIMIEDNLDAAVKIAAKGVNVLLFDYPWNRCVDGYCKHFSSETMQRIHRVFAWSDILDYINHRETHLPAYCRKGGEING